MARRRAGTWHGMGALDELLAVAGDAIAPGSGLPDRADGVDESLWAELGELLARRNGFYAFDSALHVLSLEEQIRWNTPDGWRREWREEWDGCWCFAQDVFGSQFALAGDRVVMAEAETGERDQLADSLEGWADRLLGDTDYLTGRPLAREWQAANGELPAGKRLFPKLPFMLGGEYAAANLGAVDAQEAMAARGDIFGQVSHLPEGTEVRLRIRD